MTTNVQAQTGNRIQVEFNNKPIGLVQSVRQSDDYSPEPASGVGDIHVIEYVPTRATHRISVSEMVLIKRSMRKSGISLVNGDDALKGVVFNIVEYSRDTDEALRTYEGVSYASGSVSVDAHRIVMASAEFNAIDVKGTGL
jgi:hypothetical protein